jgi:hypothetical protein
MPDGPAQDPTADLERRASLHLGDPLLPAELKLVRAVPNGEFVVCGPSQNWDDPTNDPAEAHRWGPERRIRAELIRWLCVDRRAKDLADPLGISVLGAIIGDVINLTYVPAPFPLTFHRCRLDRLHLNNARLPALDLSGTILNFARADGAVIRGGVLLRAGFRALGGMRMVGAEIGSSLDLSSAQLRSAPGLGAPEVGVALRADRLLVNGSVYMDLGFTAEGAVLFLNAKVGGDLQCDSGEFVGVPHQNPELSGISLSLDSAHVGGHVFLRKGFHSQGKVRLVRAQIGGDLGCMDAVFANPYSPNTAGSGTSLDASGIVVEQSAYLRCRFQGQVNLASAKIGGNLECDRAEFSNPRYANTEATGTALNANSISVGGSVQLQPGVRATGAVTFLQAQVHGDFACEGAIITNRPLPGVALPAGCCLLADGATVQRSMFLRAGFHSEGEVRLIGTRINGYLDCTGARFENPPQFGGSGVALRAERAPVAGGVMFDRDALGRATAVSGDVTFDGAQVQGDFRCSASTFSGNMSLVSASIKGRIIWKDIGNPENARLILTGTSAGSILDDDRSWPPKGNLLLDGFVFDRIFGEVRDAVSRLQWLDRMPSFSLQPYRQLAEVLRKEGETNGAQRVLFEMERRRRKMQDQDRLARARSLLFQVTVGYGYYPTPYAVGWLAALTLLGFSLFWFGFSKGIIVPTGKEDYLEFKNGAIPGYYERFHASMYSLENSVPVIKLGQSDRWQPDPAGRSHGLAWALAWIRRAQIVLGWFFTTMFVTGITGIVRKE